MIDLTGKHIFIVGGSRGIGAEIARQCGAAGAAISINYAHSAERAEALASEIIQQGGRALSICADASLEGALDTATDLAAQEFGPVDGMVVSAGIFEGCPLEEMTAAFWDRTMAINLRSSFLAVRAAARQMRATGKGGSIILITSTAGQRGSSVYSAYAASKAGQIIFMRSMAKELGPDQVRVNCIAPAWTETEMAAPSLELLGREKVAEGFALGRIGKPADVAGAACYLLSDLASFVTGSTITVDGGMDMRG